MLFLCDPVSLMHVNRPRAAAQEFDSTHSRGDPL